MGKFVTVAVVLALGCAGTLSAEQAKIQPPAKASVKSAVAPKKASSSSVKSKADARLLVADFNSGATENNLGMKFGAWDKDPNDETQKVKTEFTAPGREGKNRCLSITYDVDSPNPAYNGFWMKLGEKDIRAYNKFSFWIKGDKDDGYTTRLKIELKDMNAKGEQETSPYYIDTITSDWQNIEIPLSSFGALSNKAKMTEFVIVFEDSQATEKVGHIYIDDIEFVK